MVVLTEQQIEYLNDESKRLGLSVNEIVRRAIDWYRGEMPTLNLDSGESSENEEAGEVL